MLPEIIGGAQNHDHTTEGLDNEVPGRESAGKRLLLAQQQCAMEDTVIRRNRGPSNSTTGGRLLFGRGARALFRGDVVLPEETMCLQKEFSGRVQQVQANAVNQAGRIDGDPRKLYRRRYEYQRLFDRLSSLDKSQSQVLASLDAVGWDEEAAAAKHSWVLHPDKGLKLQWDLLFVLLILYTSITVPYKIGFDVEFVGLWFGLDVMVDVAYYMDVVLSFMTAYYDKKGNLVREPTKIARRYLRGSFAIDVASSLPLDRLLELLEYGSSAKVLRSTKLLKLLRLTRVLRLLRLIQFEKWLGMRQIKLEQELQLNNAVASIIRMAFPVVLMGHLLACVFHWLVIWQQERHISPRPSTWLSRLYGSDSVVSTQLAYHSALYWAFTTTTTVGYGDVVPVTDGERLLAMLAMIIGGSTFGYIVGNVTVIFEGVDVQERSFRQRMDAIMGYVKERQLPVPLASRIRRHARQLLRQVCVYDTSLIYTALPAVVDAQLAFVQHGDVISNISFLHDKPVLMVAALAKFLRPCLVLRGETLFTRAEVGSALYFLISGAIDCILAMDDTMSAFARLHRGALLGMVGVLEESVQVYTAKAAVDSQVYWVGKDELLYVLEGWPTVRNELAMMAKDRLDQVATYRRAHPTARSPLRHLKSSIEEEEQEEQEDWLLTPQQGWLNFMAWLAGKRKASRYGVNGASSDATSHVSSQPLAHELPTQSGIVQAQEAGAQVASTHLQGGISIANPIVSSRIGVLKSYVQHELREHGTKTTPGQSTPNHSLEAEATHGASISSSAGLMQHRPMTVAIKELLRVCWSSEQPQASTKTSTDAFSLWTSHRLLHPDSRFRGYWDVLTSVLIMYSILMVTFRLGFDYNVSGILAGLDLWVDCLFLLDILLYTQTALWDDSGTLIVSRRAIVTRYATSWLIWDVCSTVPMDLLYSMSLAPDAMGGNKVLRIIRLARLVRLSRVFKVTKLLRKYEDQFNLNPALLRVFMVFSSMAFLAHFHACMFYYIGAMASTDRGEGDESWVERYCPGDGRRCLSAMSYSEKYTAALYWSFTTMCTVGYGDVTPAMRRPNELTWAMVTQLVGATVFAYSISSMVELLASMDLPDKLRKEDMAALRDYLASLAWGPRRTSRHRLMRVVRRVYTQHLGFRSVFPEQELLLDLPPYIRNQVLRHSYRSLSLALPALSLMDRTFRGSFPLIAQRMRWVAFVKGEVVSSPNTACREMYFLGSGWCQATPVGSSSEQQIIKISPGETFNEATFLIPDYIPIRFVHTVTALTDCQMAVYTKRDFEELRLVYPAVASLFRSTFLSVTPAKVHSALSIPPAFEDEIDRIFWPQDTTDINPLPKI